MSTAQGPPALDWAERERNLDLLHNEVVDRLASLASASERIETKAIVVAGFAATALQFVLTKQQRTGTWWAAAAAFALSFSVALLTIALRRVADPPKPRELQSSYSDKRRAESLAKILGTKVLAYEKNARANLQKAVAWWLSVTLLIAGLTFSISNSTQGSPNEQERVIQKAVATAAADEARAAADAARADADGTVGRPGSGLPASRGGP